MLQQLLISTLALFVMIAGWYCVQRLTQQGRTKSDVDFLKGRYGCGTCSSADACDPEEKTAEALRS